MLFFRLFNPGVPLCMLLIVIFLSSLVSCIILCKYRKDCRWRLIWIVWVSACLYLMLYSTVLGRNSEESMSIQLIPFWSVEAIQDGLIETLYEKVYNVIFFVPLGALFSFRGFCNRAQDFKITIIMGFLTSVSIELLQLITRTGTCETDDVICNTAGCGIGAMIAICFIRLFKRLKRGH